MKVSYTAPVKHGKSHMVYLYQYHKKSIASISDGIYRWMTIIKPYKEYCIKQYQYDTIWGLKNWYRIDRIDSQGDLLFRDGSEFHHRKICLNSNNLSYEKSFDTDLILHPIKMLGYCGDIASMEFVDKLDLLIPDYPPSKEVISHLRTRNNLIAYDPKLERMLELNYKYGPKGYDSLDEYISIVKYRISVTKKLYEVYPKVFEYYDIPYKMFDINECDYQKETGLKCPDFILNDIKFPALQTERFPDINISDYESQTYKMV